MPVARLVRGDRVRPGQVRTAYEPGDYLVGRKIPGVQGRLLVPVRVVALAGG